MVPIVLQNQSLNRDSADGSRDPTVLDEGEAHPHHNSVKPEKDTMAEGGESDALKAIIAYDSTNFQWQKLAHNWSLIALLTIITLLKGPGDDSIIGTVRCTGQDWGIFISL